MPIHFVSLSLQVSLLFRAAWVLPFLTPHRWVGIEEQTGHQIGQEQSFHANLFLHLGRMKTPQLLIFVFSLFLWRFCILQVH